MATKLGAVAKCDYSELLCGCSRRLVGNKVVVSFRGFVPRSYRIIILADLKTMAQCSDIKKYTKSWSFVAIIGALNEKLFRICESLRKMIILKMIFLDVCIKIYPSINKIPNHWTSVLC